MQAIERLFSCASAHGIDLRQAAGECAKLYGPGSPRRRNLMERLAGGRPIDEKAIKGTMLESAKTVTQTVRGTQTRVAKPKLYSHVELGHALSGLTGAPYLTAMFSFGLDDQVYEDLCRALRKAVAEIAERDRWPLKVDGFTGRQVFFGDELCEVVLAHDWCAPMFAKIPGLYGIMLGVTDDVWRERLMRYYTEALSRYERWQGIARAYVERSTREELEAEAVGGVDESENAA
jgi:hypothetical protein